MGLAMLRRSAATAAPLAMRLVGRSRHHTSAGLLLSAVKHGGARRFFPSAVHFSTEAAKVSSSDKTLIKVLKSEIDCADEEEAEEDAEDIPEDFPFKIEDIAGENVVKLTRQYEGEKVEVEVYGLENGSGDNEDDDDKDDDEQTITLVVRISKDVGPYLEFNCRATRDEISIEDIELKDPKATEESAYVGPYFVGEAWLKRNPPDGELLTLGLRDLDEVLQKAFHRYLTARGITTSAMNYMHEYMANKDIREYKIWLENLRKFVEA